MSQNAQRQSKYWCFTLNNYTGSEEDSLKALVDDGVASYLVFAREVGEQGTPHLQGYVELPRKLRMSRVKTLLGNRVHLEPRRGTAAQADEYCRKESTPPEDVFTFGTISTPKPGTRSDLDRAVEAIRDGATVPQLWDEHSKAMVRYHQGLLTLRANLVPDRVGSRYELDSFNARLPADSGRSIILVGPPGCGKTALALATYPDALFVSHMDDLGDYVPGRHSGIIFDDMSFTHLPRGAQIHLVDREQPRSIHIRYKRARIPAGVPKVFTTNVESIVDLTDMAISRRIHVVRVPADVKLYRVP